MAQISTPIDNLKRLTNWRQRRLVFAGHVLQQQRADMPYPFDQEANFLYLTGIEEPGWWLLALEGECYLVEPPLSKVERLFNGGLSAEEATRMSGVDKVIDRKQAMALLREDARRHDSIETLLRHPRESARQGGLNLGPITFRRLLGRLYGEVLDVRRELARLRAIKQPHELAALRQAVQLTAEAFGAVTNSWEELDSERLVAATMGYHFERAGGRHAYEPIVAAGRNACTLHYIKNDAPLRTGDLVLIDVGARFGGMCADVTRTYVRGQMSDRQRAVFEAVRLAQQEIIALIRPGVRFADYGTQSDEIMQRALRSLGLKGLQRYFPHAVSHGLGLDVHESLGGYDSFMPGMVLTVEPGIYIPEEAIGVRIEDDILVTEEGNENLTRAVVY